MNVLSYIVLGIALVLTLLTTVSYFVSSTEEEVRWDSVVLVLLWWVAAGVVRYFAGGV